MKKKGFTLIELLVVIAVIAVLMGILMPALRRVREQARMTNCTANMKQWATVLHMRASENNGVLFRGNGPAGYWWVCELDKATWDWTINKTWLCPSATKPVLDLNGNRIGTFNINNAWGLFPDGASAAGGARMSFLPNGISGSYGLNGYLINIPNGEYFGSGHTKAEDGWRNLNTVKQAASVPMFTEGLRFDLWPQSTEMVAANETEAWSSNNMARCAINRHQGFVCTAFADGSARKVGLKELYVLKWSKVFNTSGPYTKAGGVVSSAWPEWIRKFPDY